MNILDFFKNLREESKDLKIPSFKEALGYCFYILALVLIITLLVFFVNYTIENLIKLIFRIFKA